MKTTSYSEKYKEKLKKKYIWNYTLIKQYIIEVFSVDEALVGSILRRCKDFQYKRISNISSVGVGPSGVKCGEFSSAMQITPECKKKTR